MSKYSFEVEHFLSDQEIVELEAECAPSLLMLNLRYTPEVDLSQGYSALAEHLDAIRTSWLLDAEGDRPQHTALVKGLGLAFGMLLQQRTALRWCRARDSDSTFVSMVRVDDSETKISVPVFNYIEKRETLQNAEVFRDFFKQVPSHVLGEKSVGPT